MFKSIWEEEALEELNLLRQDIAIKIKKKVDNYLINSPITLGEQLTGKRFKGLYRYRYGNHRIIYEVSLATKIITIVRVGDRKEIYK